MSDHARTSQVKQQAVTRLHQAPPPKPSPVPFCRALPPHYRHLRSTRRRTSLAARAARQRPAARQRTSSAIQRPCEGLRSPATGGEHRPRSLHAICRACSLLEARQQADHRPRSLLLQQASCRGVAIPSDRWRAPSSKRASNLQTLLNSETCRIISMLTQE